MGCEDEGGCFYIRYPDPWYVRAVRWLNPFYVYRRIVGWWRWRKFMRGPGFEQMSLPLIRRVWPNLIVNQLVEVQPMSTPTDLVFTMDHRYGSGSSD